MRKTNYLIIFAFALVFFINLQAHAQQSTDSSEELSLEDEIRNAQPAQPQNQSTIETATPSSSSSDLESELTNSDQTEITLDSPKATVSAPVADDDSEAESFKELVYAVDGFSVGFGFEIKNFQTKGNIQIRNASGDQTGNIGLDNTSKEFQMLGVMARYTSLPVGQIGADLNVSFSGSLNHDEYNYGQIFQTKIEGNLAYTLELSKGFYFYPFIGGGYELINGTDIESIVAPSGNYFHVGGGILLGKVMTLEGFYSRGAHLMNDSYAKAVGDAAIASTANTYTFDKLSVINESLGIRLSIYF